jgi:N-acetylglucosaminyldiphosphoundecaprenol N-acetyl-beta-D-mannosaminyltransferase
MEVKTQILGIPLQKFGFSVQDFLSSINANIPERKPCFYASFNLHAISFLKKDEDFLQALNSAEKIRFDGVAAIWLGRLSGAKKIEKIGSDVLMSRIFPEAEKKDWKLYFLGGPEGAAEKAVKNIKEHHPGLQVIGTHHGFFSDSDEAQIIEEINLLSPDILVVGLGMPYQEKWIFQNKEKLKVGVITSCGAYIEQIGEKGLGYFPDWVNKCHLSWLLRIIRDPKKFGKRYFTEGILFIPLLFKTALARIFKR